MSDKTGIEWTDATWNPLRGCSKISAGCAHCYAETMAARFSGQPKGPFKDVITDGKWNGTIQLVPEKLTEPLKWKSPRRIFVNSMSDLFHADVPFEFIDQVFAVMALAPQHTFQVLTKRPERMARYFADQNRAGLVQVSMKQYPMKALAWPLPNVWLGVSVENQQCADERIPHLLRTPAAVRFLSMEPLLGPVDLRFGYGRCSKCAGWERDNLIHKLCADCGKAWVKGAINWVIVGGESGHASTVRPMHPDWVRSIRDQCVSAGVPFFFKQWGEWEFGMDTELPFILLNGSGDVLRDDEAWDVFGTKPLNSSVVAMNRVGKKAAGRMLDGREWSEFPQSVAVAV